MIQIPIAVATKREKVANAVLSRLPVRRLTSQEELGVFLGLNERRCLLIDSDFPDVCVPTTISQSLKRQVSTIVLGQNVDTRSVSEYFRAGALDVLEGESISEVPLERWIAEVLGRSSLPGPRAEYRNDFEDLVKIARHDLKAPLRTIAGFSKLLGQTLGDRLSDDEREYLEFINTSANKGYQLMERLKVFAEISPDPAAEQVSLEGPALLASNSERVRQGKGEVCLQWTSAPVVRGNETALVKLFSELIDNGLKFNASPRPKVEVAASREGDYWRIEVRDNGIGVEESHWQRVFEPLCRLNPDAEFEGSGLGLSICKRIVGAQDGTIEIRSNGSQGSSVWINLPAAD